MALFLHFRMTSIGQMDLGYESWTARDNLCNIIDNGKQINFETPFEQFIESRYVFTTIDTFSFSVFLFYSICLSELHQDKQRKTDELLWSLGISKSEQMVSWYLAIITQAMIWSAINFVQLMPVLFSLSSNLFILWLCLTLTFLVAAIFALISSKFVKGTLTFLLAIFQMLITWVVLVMWSNVQNSLPYPSSKAIRLAILLHPVAQARNLFQLAQAAEFSKIGINLFSLNSYFNVPEQMFFGNTLETLCTMLVFSILASLLFLVNFGPLWTCVIGLIFKKKSKHEHVGRFEVHEELQLETKKQPVVEVSGLTKKYKNGTQAVTNVSFSIYEGEIVGLLGKNGAGKSTTMNIISGFHSATAGDVKICGIDSKINRKEALSKLSFCPQEDRFFYRLTVMEHLKFMCMLKGSQFNRERCVKLLQVLGLFEKSSQKPRNISGGQKRRVCIAMAYAANSPLIILDEPTSAVDAATRKTLWSFFQTQQQENPNQAVILCTHFMQEADVLSQRIAIISDGYLRAIGTASYLKSLFGVGYTFTYASEFESSVREIVLKYCPEANFPPSDDGGLFQIATEKSSCLSKILDQLDEKKVEYSFNAATLENVFVSLSNNRAAGEKKSTDSTKVPNLLNVNDTVDKGSMQSVMFENSEQHDRSEKICNNFFSWLISQVKFALLVDLFRVVMQNLKFLILFPIVLFGIPHLIMLLCYLDQFVQDSEGIFAHGNITVTPFTLNTNPKVAVFGNAPDSEMKKLQNKFEKPGMKLIDSISEEDIMRKYQEAPTEIFNIYPFFLKYNQNSGIFDCVINNHFQSSTLLCLTAMVPIYSSSEFAQNLKVAVTYFPKESQSSWIDEENEARESSALKTCQSAICLFMPVYIYPFLLYFIIRIESLRNDQNLASFFRANGAFQLFSLFVRISGYFVLTFGYFAAIVFYYEERNFKYSDADFLKFETLGPFALFSFTFVCFAIFIAKFFSSILIHLGLTVIVFVLYQIFFFSRQLHDSLTEMSRWFYLLIVPGYVIPTGGLGLLFSSDPKSNKEASTYWLIQSAVFFTLIVVIESLLLRVFFNFVSSIFRRRRSVQVHGEEVAVNVSDVRHSYYGIAKSVRALRGMNMSVREGECYALLGVNGAGKSTMFEILTSGIRLQSGLVEVFGKSVALNPWGVLRDVGYCSQMDKCVGYLKAETLVRLFGFLRGLTASQVTQQIQFMAKILDAESHMGKLLSRCSGGTRRKVSTMIAFIGFPKLVILDESTTGK